jgi:hypothetical protein
LELKKNYAGALCTGSFEGLKLFIKRKKRFLVHDQLYSGTKVTFIIRIRVIILKQKKSEDQLFETHKDVLIDIFSSG